MQREAQREAEGKVREGYRPPSHQVWLSGIPLKGDLVYTSNGFPVFRFTLAGESEDGGQLRPHYFPVRVIGKMAESLAEQIEAHRGGVVVAGELEQYAPKEGTSRTSLLARFVRLIPEEQTLFGSKDAKGQVRETLSLNRFVGTGLAVSAVSEAETGSGRVVRKFRGAFRQSGTKKSNAFLSVVAWGSLGSMLEGIEEGSLFVVEGLLRRNLWTDKEGQVREEVQVSAQVLKPIGKVDLQAKRQDKEKNGGRAKAWPRLNENPDLELEEDLPF
jgi:single-stranded DNA-binding protein